MPAIEKRHGCLVIPADHALPVVCEERNGSDCDSASRTCQELIRTDFSFHNLVSGPLTVGVLTTQNNVLDKDGAQNKARGKPEADAERHHDIHTGVHDLAVQCAPCGPSGDVSHKDFDKRVAALDAKEKGLAQVDNPRKHQLSDSYEIG